MSEYGSVFREAMMRSMEKPAGEFKQLNRRDPEMVRAPVLIVVFVLVLALGIGAVFLLDRVEAHFRPAAVTVR